MKSTHPLHRGLRTLQPLEPIELTSVAGGREVASTSTSGTPAAGDDTIGDPGGGGGGGGGGIAFVGGWGSRCTSTDRSRENTMKHTLTKQLRPLAILDSDALARIAGGAQVASTSTSGTPEAGDDTIGDSVGRVSLSDFSIMKNIQ